MGRNTQEGNKHCLPLPSREAPEGRTLVRGSQTTLAMVCCSLQDCSPRQQEAACLRPQTEGVLRGAGSTLSYQQETGIL